MKMQMIERIIKDKWKNSRYFADIKVLFNNSFIFQLLCYYSNSLFASIFISWFNLEIIQNTGAAFLLETGSSVDRVKRPLSAAGSYLFFAFQ